MLFVIVVSFILEVLPLLFFVAAAIAEIRSLVFRGFPDVRHPSDIRLLTFSWERRDSRHIAIFRSASLPRCRSSAR